MRTPPKLDLIHFFLALSCGIVLFTTACSTRNQKVLSFVPLGSHYVLGVDWQTVRRDPDLRRFSKAAELENLFKGIGINEETVLELAAFGESGAAAGSSNGIVISGKFNSSGIVKSLKEHGWSEQTAEGKRILVKSSDGSCLGTLGEKLLVVGTRSGVSESLGAKANSRNRFTANPVYKTLISRFETKKSPVVMMVAFPQASHDTADVALQLFAGALDLAGVGPLGDLLNKVGYARGLGCAISRDREVFPIALSAVMKDEESARFVAGSLGLLKSLAAVAPKSNTSLDTQEAAKAFINMSVERNRTVVSIKIAMTRDQLMSGN